MVTIRSSGMTFGSNWNVLFCFLFHLAVIFFANSVTSKVRKILQSKNHIHLGYSNSGVIWCAEDSSFYWCLGWDCEQWPWSPWVTRFWWKKWWKKSIVLNLTKSTPPPNARWNFFPRNGRWPFLWGTMKKKPLVFFTGNRMPFRFNLFQVGAGSYLLAIETFGSHLSTIRSLGLGWWRKCLTLGGIYLTVTILLKICSESNV